MKVQTQIVALPGQLVSIVGFGETGIEHDARIVHQNVQLLFL